MSPSQAPLPAPLPAPSSVPGCPVPPAHTLYGARHAASCGVPGVAGNIALPAAPVGAAARSSQGTCAEGGWVWSLPWRSPSVLTAYSRSPRRWEPSPGRLSHTRVRGSGDVPAPPGRAVGSKAGGCSTVPIPHRVRAAVARADGWPCPGCATAARARHARGLACLWSSLVFQGQSGSR